MINALNKIEKIVTPFGVRYVSERLGYYVHTYPTPSAIHGEWWVASGTGSYKPIASNNPGLKAAYAEYIWL